MSLPKVPPLSMSQLRTQFGGPLPVNFSAYHAGAGLVPLGTTNALNNQIPSTGVMSLSQFLGAPNGILLSDYVGQLQYYNRNYVNWQAGFTPASNTANNNSGAYSVPPNGGNYGAELFQKYQFSNSSLKTSPGCTVVFTFAGKNWNGAAAPLKPGGSAVGAIANAINQFEAFYVYAENDRHLLAPSYVYLDYNNTSAQVFTVVAWYACSATAITKVVGGWDAVNLNKSFGEWPALQIIPGLWTPTAYAFNGNAFNLNLPANTFSLTVSERDGDGVYALENPTGMGLTIVYEDHWYNNASFQWNFNTSTSTKSVTYSAQGSSESGAIYTFTQNTDGAPVGINVTNGINVRGFGTPYISAKTSFVVSGGTSQTASIVFMPSGGCYGTGDGGTTIYSFDNTAFGGGADAVWGWYCGATLTGTPPGNNYWIKATATSATTPTTGTVGVWIPLSSNVTFALNYTGSTSASCPLTFQIATDSSGSNAVNLGGVTLTVANGSSGGGGGGGGGCVAVDSFLPNFGLARDVQVGDELDLADQVTLDAATGIVTYSQPREELGFRIVTESGVSLRCSDTAPIPIEDGTLRNPEQLLGERVAVKKIDGNGATVTYETVTDVQPIGRIMVQYITVGDRCFWAGERFDAFILHHNVIKAPKPLFKAKQVTLEEAARLWNPDPTQSNE